MAKATHIITGPARTGLAKALGQKTESAAVYGKADLDARLAAAAKDGVKVTVTEAK